MPRLIDADALYQSFGASGNCNNCPLDAYKCQYYNEHTLMEFCERIDEAPTVDAEPVVRCKDCKECEERHTANYLPFLYCKLHGHSVLHNAFCCWAERREDVEIH